MKFGTRAPTHSFNQVATTNAPRSQFNMSHTIKTAFDSGYLVPIFGKVAYPGDTFNIKANCFAKLSTPIVPVMDGLYLDTFWFAVPWRLVWSNFKKFMGEQANPGDSVSYTIPRAQCPAGGYAVATLQDYFGLPTAGQITGANQYYHNNLMMRAYNLIWNEWFRDENMQNSVTVDLGDGPDTYSNYVLLRRGKRKDYFSGALPFLQKGTAVTLPLGTIAPVWGTVNLPMNLQGVTSGAKGAAIATTTSSASAWTLNADITGAWTATEKLGLIQSGANASGLYADLAGATAATINQFRQAIQVQGLYEKDARYGTRYTEIIQGHFGVVSSDARLQRPEYLGGGSTRLSITPVAQTNNTGATGTPQGNLAAYGLAHTPANGFVKSFEEHCLVIGLVSVRADLGYQQGLEREYTDQTKLDMYWPALANIGEQAVLTKEIYALGTSQDEDVFGYQERYGHLRYWPSRVSGIMRSTASGTIDIYHLSQKFTSKPTLGDTYIKETPPVSRVVAVNTEPQFIFDAFIEAINARPMPTYGVPATLGRF